MRRSNRTLAALRSRRRIVSVLLAATAAAAIGAPYSVSDDLPGPGAHVETIPAGSLVIPMDNALQSLVAPFNLKAYGLVNHLLQNGIPLKWAIRAGKTKDANDFSATAQRIAPTATGGASVNFSGGPFIVHRDFAQIARAYITTFGNNVAVYQTTADANVDIRYDLRFRPNIAVNDDNATIHTNLFDFAAIPNYTVIPGASLLAGSCYTIFTEPHTNNTSGVAAVKAYVQAGGNFLAECLAVDTYENAGHFQTTLGINTNNLNNVLTYPNADLAFTQFTGIVDPAPGGSHQDWNLVSGSVFQNNGYVVMDNVGASPPAYAATVAKLYGGAGGMVFYIGGHDYGAGGSDITDINGQRMILNTIFVPNDRPSCGFDFTGALRTISGTVYEDVNGDGSLADGVARSGVNVRLYQDANNNGVVDTGDLFLATGTTDVSGAYSFQVSTLASGNNYLVVVDSKSVTPSAGLNGGFTQGDVWAEQTYGDNPATSAFDLGTRFGGRTGNISDRFNTADTTPANNTYEHVARIDAAAGNVTGVNFGFSFNVVTDVRGGDATDDDASANRTVQGTLRQFLQNANAISGANRMRFVPAVAANAGSWWRISVTSALPAITDGSTTVSGRAFSSADGTTILDPNAGTLGAGGTVGVGALALPTVNKPELEIQDIRGTAVINVGLDVQANSVTIQRLAIFGFGSAANSDTSANIRIGASGTNADLEENIIGTTAGSVSDPGAATRSVGDNVRVIGGSGAFIRNNVIGFSGGNGIGLSNATAAQILMNEVRGNGLSNNSLGGLSLGSGTSASIQTNLFIANAGAGLDVANGAGANSILQNSVSGNGTGGTVTAGVRLLGSSNTLDRNIITANTGSGVIVGASAGQDAITQNSIFANGAIGIDLLAAADNQNTGTAPYVTINDSGDSDTGGNGLLNFPILASATVSGSNLVISGWARPGSVIELFIADPDPTNFGEGKTFLATLTEGSASDVYTNAGPYASPVNGLNQGGDTTNRYSFTIPLPSGVSVGTILTATATVGGATSEFSGNVTAGLSNVSGYVYEDANLNLIHDSTEVGTGLTLYVKLVDTTAPAGPAIAAAVVNPATGAYTIAIPASGTYTLVLDDNNTLSDVTPTLPAGWSGTEMGNGLRTPVSVATGNLGNQNFGLYHGLLLTGRVFNDNGTGGGTANDGILNGGEPGLGGVVVKLTDNAGSTVYATITTNDGGSYALPIPSTIAGGTPLKLMEANVTGFIATGASVGNTAGTYDRTTNTISFGLIANTTYTNVNFGHVLPSTLSTDGQLAGLPGTTLFYAHTFTAGTGGSVSFATVNTSNPALNGWSTNVYRDLNKNGQLDANEPEIVAPISVNAGDVVAIIAKIFIPTNAPLGASNRTTLTATFVYVGATPALNAALVRQDVTTVGNPTTAGLTLNKSVDKPSALPGETITYTIRYANTSSDVLGNVVISDATPAFTTFVSANNGSLPQDLTAVTPLTPSVGGTGAVRWTFAGTLRPGGSGTVSYQVKVNQ